MSHEAGSRKTGEITPILTGSVLQFKVVLRGSRPSIWRRIQVPEGLSLSALHEVIQVVMGWAGYHMHEFSYQGLRYGVPDPDWGDGEVLDERDLLLSDLSLSVKDKIFYEYDFGDGWEHVLTLEKILTLPELRTPLCLKGARACPPEDCGGIWGYEELLNALKDPDHEEHESMTTWLGGSFDPERFGLDGINRRLSHTKWVISPPRRRGSKRR